jgi:hypothetical protein
MGIKRAMTVVLTCVVLGGAIFLWANTRYGRVQTSSPLSLDEMNAAESARARDVLVSRRGDEAPPPPLARAERFDRPTRSREASQNPLRPIQPGASIATSAAPVPMDDAAIEAAVAKSAKPAQVKFDVETKMAMGQVYEARLEIRRPEAGKESLFSSGTPEIDTRVQILNRARATISSAHLKIERLLPEWQDMTTGGRGYWTWKVEPQTRGKATLIVLVEHLGTFDGKERIFNVEQFPKTILIEVGFWQGVQEAITGVSPSIAAMGTIAGALVAIGGAGAGVWAWLRSRRRGGGGDDDSHGIATT